MWHRHTDHGKPLHILCDLHKGSTSREFYPEITILILTFLFPCSGVRNDFRIKTMFRSYLPPFVCRRTRVLLCFCLYLSLVVSNTCCVVFFALLVFTLFLVSPMLSFSLDCSFLIATFGLLGRLLTTTLWCFWFILRYNSN